MKKALLLLAGIAVAASSAFAGVNQLYGIGQIDAEWGNFASGAVGKELTKVSDGVFTWSGEVAAVAYFGFASELGDWNTVNSHRFSPTTKDALAVVGDNQMVANQDASWKINPGKYTFTINTNTMVFTVVETEEVEKVITYAIHGQLNGLTDTDWETVEMTATEGNDDEWSANVKPAVTGGEFGIIQQINGSQSEWYAAGVGFDATTNTAVLNGTPEGNCYFDLPAGETYTFTFVPSTKTLTVKAAENAVSDITVDANAPVEYFNLQGVRVANPTAGALYIVRQGDKVTKTVVR